MPTATFLKYTFFKHVVVARSVRVVCLRSAEHGRRRDANTLSRRSASSFAFLHCIALFLRTLLSARCIVFDTTADS